MGVGLVRSLQPPDILWIHWRVYNFIANTGKGVLFLPLSDAYIRSFLYLLSIQFSSVAQSCPTLCNPMNCSTPGLPVQHQLPEFTPTHVHWVSDAIQSSHPLSSCSPPAPNPSKHQSFPMSQLFPWGGQSTELSALASFLPKKSQGWSPCSPRDSQESSPTPQFKSINSLAFSFLHSPTLISIHDHWKNHSID